MCVYVSIHICRYTYVQGFKYGMKEMLPLLPFCRCPLPPVSFLMPHWTGFFGILPRWEEEFSFSFYPIKSWHGFSSLLRAVFTKTEILVLLLVFSVFRYRFLFVFPVVHLFVGFFSTLCDRLELALWPGLFLFFFWSMINCEWMYSEGFFLFLLC